MPAVTETGELYSAPVAFVYVFNLIIGAGALTMPKAFAGAGWLISSILICLLAAMSFVTATFMVEAMAAANALLRVQSRNRQEINDTCKANNGSESISRSDIADHEIEPLLNCSKANIEMSLYEITTRVEMGQMAKMFFNKIGQRLFYLCLVIYLYGDLAIYAAAVPKSLTQISCGGYDEDVHTRAPKISPGNVTRWINVTAADSTQCWGSITDINVYRIYLLIFTLTLGPFSFFNIQKTKYMQLGTTVMRWLAFTLMIVLALVRVGEVKRSDHISVADFTGVPNLFGVCVYSFMCQHSLPSLITPMKNKSRISLLFTLDYTIVLLFYSLLSFSAFFAYENLDDLYTLNFWTYKNDFVRYYLALFPVFTLSTNFPIISGTLRDNLKNLFYREGRPYPWAVDRIVFPLITILPPIIVAFATQNLEVLVGITGSYAGTGVQYVIPATLVYCGRKKLRNLLGCYDNKHRSVFRQRSWIYFVCTWAVVCIVLVTTYHIITKK